MQELNLKKVTLFWLPLAATWLMMSLEGPLIAAVIARLAEPKYNLAAYGVAFAFALIVEAPIIMMLSASTALVKSKHSFYTLRNFTYLLNLLITVVMIVIILPPVFNYLSMDLIGLSEKVARLTRISVIILLPWPGAIGYRRFYQGILIRNNLTRRVAYGTIIRLFSMAATVFVMAYILRTKGAYAGAAALSVGVIFEAAASRIMAWKSVQNLKDEKLVLSDNTEKELTYPQIWNFYYPLALTSLLGLAVHPLVTFFIGQSRMALDSLAVLPVINSLIFIFRSAGLSYQEVAITFLGSDNAGYRVVRNFALVLMGSVTLLLGLISFTDLSVVWFQTISGLSAELTAFAITPTRILTILPAMTVLISFQRAMLVNARRTQPITLATAIEVTGIVLVLFITIHLFHWIGAVAAALALLIGRTASNSFLMIPLYQVMHRNKTN